MNTPAQALFLVLAMSLPHSVFASEGSSDEEGDVWRADPIVVTATRLEQRARDLAANVTVLDREEVERSASITMDDMLRQVPGFSLFRQASSIVSSSSVQGVSLRGLGQNTTGRTLVLLDGVPLNDPFGYFVTWSRIPFESIERVEVVRGGGSGIWGNLSLGGVIHVLTEMPEERTIRLRAEGGSKQTGNFDLYAADRKGSFSYSAGVSFFDTDGYYLWRKDLLGPIDRPANETYTTCNGKLVFHPSEGRRFYVSAHYSEEDKERGTPLTLADMISRFFGAGADWRTSGGSLWDWNIFLTSRNRTDVDTDVSRDRDSEEITGGRYYEPSTAIGTNLQWSKEVIEGHRFVIGADYLWIDSESNEHDDWNEDTQAFETDRSVGGKQRLSGIYAQDIWRPSIWWNVVAAARFDRIENFDGAELSRDPETGEVKARTHYPNEVKYAFSPSLGVVRHLSSKISLRGSAYRAFRAPTVDELYRSSASTGGTVSAANPDLGPEFLDGGEIGLDFRHHSIFSAKLTGFWNVVDGTISRKTIAETGDSSEVIDPCGEVPAGGTCKQDQNVGTMRSRGFELDLRFDPYRDWSFLCSYVYNDASMTESGETELVGKRIRQVPRHSFVVGAAFKNRSLFSASVLGKYVGERYEDDLSRYLVSDFFVVDLKVSRTLAPWSELFVSVENLFDREYEIRTNSRGLVGVGMPRLVRGGVRVRL